MIDRLVCDRRTARHTERASRIAASSATRQNYLRALPFEV